MNHSDLSFPSMTQHVQHLPSSMHIVTQHFTALSRMHACGEISQCERLGELGADPSSPPGLQPNNDMHKLTMIQSSLAKAQTAHGCNFRACPFQVFSAGSHEGWLNREGPAPWAYYSPAAAYVLHSGDQGSVVRRERSAPSGRRHRPRRPSPGHLPAHGGSSSHRRARPESRRRQEQQASPVCTAPANLRNLAA